MTTATLHEKRDGGVPGAGWPEDQGPEEQGPEIEWPEDEWPEDEWQVRVDLAACYRLAAHFGWDDILATHISARVPNEPGGGEAGVFLINPFGLRFDEITASSLLRIDLAGNQLDDSPFRVNPAGFTIHSAVHEVRHDAGCVMHLHTIDGMAVSALEEGLLPLNQTAMFPAADLAYHDFEGVALDLAERARVQADLGSANYLMLRNHGTLTVGRTVADAFMRMYFLERACSAQVRTLGMGRPFRLVPEGALARTQTKADQGPDDGMGGYPALAWPALLRLMDRHSPGYDA